MPQLSLSEAAKFLGRYFAAEQRIELSRGFVLSHDWTVVLEVLKHEMAHQFVVEVLREVETPHGPAFQATCERLGIDSRSQGLPQAQRSPEQTRLLERIHKLLALAESDNRNEAEAAAAAAQKLMLRHNIDVHERAESHDYTFRQIGRITGRVSEWERRLGNILRDYFFVEIIWVSAFVPSTGKRGSVMEAIGSPENLDLAHYVYDFLLSSAERLWKQHQRSEGIKSNQDRAPYYAGVMSGFAQKLAAQQKAQRSDGLVWVPHAQLAQYTRKRHPYLRTIRQQGHKRRDAFQEGQKAGRDVVLHRGITGRNSGNQVRLLKG